MFEEGNAILGGRRFRKTFQTILSRITDRTFDSTSCKIEERMHIVEQNIMIDERKAVKHYFLHLFIQA